MTDFTRHRPAAAVAREGLLPGARGRRLLGGEQAVVRASGHPEGLAG